MTSSKFWTALLEVESKEREYDLMSYSVAVTLEIPKLLKYIKDGLEMTYYILSFALLT